MRRRVGLLIGLFGLTMTGLLVRREGLLSPVVDPAPAASQLTTDDVWLGWFAGEAEQRRRAGEDGAIRIEPAGTEAQEANA